MKDYNIQIIFIILLIVIFIFFVNKINNNYNYNYKNDNIILNKIQDIDYDVYDDYNIGYINKQINNNIKTLKGKCDINIYTQSTLYDELNKKLTTIINKLINIYTGMDFNEYYIYSIKYVKEQIDNNNNKRYLVTLFINYNESFKNDKIYVDFILYNNGSIHFNKLNNNINSYNTLINNVKPIDNIKLIICNN